MADINRSTFYSHYSSQHDLLHSIEEELIKDMIATLSQYSFSKEEDTLLMTEKILEYIAEKHEVCKILLSENSDIHFQKKGMLIMKEHIYKNWVPNSQVDQESLDYLSLFVVSGSIHVIKNWLEKGMDKTPRELALILTNFTNKGLSEIVK
jgi:AcrR family transcriptional regulator